MFFESGLGLESGVHFAGIRVSCQCNFTKRTTMIAGIQSALSGLQAVATKIENTANNVTNMNTDGF